MKNPFKKSQSRASTSAPARRSRRSTPSTARRRTLRPVSSRPSSRPSSPSARSIVAGIAGDLTADWSTYPVHIHSLLAQYLRPIRARSRERAINDDLARKYVSQSRNNLVGATGVTVQSQAINADGSANEDARRVIEAGFRDWGRKGLCDVTGALSWFQSQNLFAETAPVDGEVLVHLVDTTKFNKYGLSLQFLDTEQLPVNLVEEVAGGTVNLGVELNKWKRPTHYHVQKAASSYYTVADYDRIPADNIIHSFITERVGQLRGIPWMVSSLYRMKMLAGYIESSAVNARASAAKSGYFKRTGDASYPGDAKADDGAWLEEVEPGKHKILPEGLEFQAYDPNFPQDQFGPFVQEMGRLIANGLGVFYNSFGNNYDGINYSSGRLGLLDERLGWMALQAWMIEDFHDRVFRRWLKNSIAYGVLKVAGRALSMQDFDLLVPAIYQAPRWPWVDPAKEGKAAAEAIDSDLETESHFIRQRGRYPEEVWHERAAELKRKREIYEEYGVEGVLGSAPAPPAPATPSEEIDEDLEDEEEVEEVDEDEGEDDDSRNAAKSRARRRNNQAMVYALARIEAGLFNLDADWTFTAADLSALADNRGRYYLGIDPEIEDVTRYTFPTGRFVDGEFTVFKSALEDIQKHTAETPGIFDAAGELLGAIETGLALHTELDAEVDAAGDEMGTPDDPKPEEEEDPPEMPEQ